MSKLIKKAVSPALKSTIHETIFETLLSFTKYDIQFVLIIKDV